jgi:hypothetical protein
MLMVVLLGFPAGAQQFTLDIRPVYTDYTGAELGNYEAGGDLLKVVSKVFLNSGASTYLQSTKACLGFKNAWPAAGFDVNKVLGTRSSATGGYNWDPTLLGKFRYFNTAQIIDSVSHNAGEVYFSVGVPSGQARKNITTTASPLYQIDFHVKDGQAASTSFVGYDNLEGVGGGENAAVANTAATGGTDLGNRLNTQNRFNYNVVAAAAPVGFRGVKSVEDTTKGNTLKIIWDALSNRIGENDWTPPIFYDIYRDTATFTPNDTGNRKFVDETGGRSFGDGAQADVFVLDGPDNGLPGTGTHVLDDNREYYFAMRAKDNTSENNNRTDAPYVHKTTGVSDVVFGPIKPHDYTPPEWSTTARTVTAGSGNTQLSVSWPRPGVNGDDVGGYVVLRQGPFTAPQSLTYPTLGGAARGTDDHGPDYTAVPAIAGWTVHRIITSDTRSFDDTGLENGKYYYYAVYAYDQFGTVGGAFQQGRNYSPAPAVGFGVPGVPPGSVNNFYAISRAAQDDITLRWDNPAVDPARPQGGTLIWYTTEEGAKWNNIPDADRKADWPTAVSGGRMKLLLNQPLLSGVTVESVTVQQDVGGARFSPTATYFFKAFAYNAGAALDPSSTDSILAHEFAAAARCAAASTLGGGAGLGTGEVTFRFFSGGLGLNQFAFHFDPGLNIRTLVEELDRQAGGGNVVTNIGWWDPVAQIDRGYIVTGTTFSSVNGANDNPALEPVVVGRAYQVAVTGSFSATFSR